MFPKRERGRLAEYAGVEPLRQALVRIFGQIRGFSVVVGPRSSSKGVREVPRNSGVPLSAVYKPLNSQPETTHPTPRAFASHFFPLPQGNSAVYATTRRCGLSNAFSARSSRRL